ncbi:MAG: phosphodiester glycosidase family protein [Nocardioides sp.]
MRSRISPSLPAALACVLAGAVVAGLVAAPTSAEEGRPAALEVSQGPGQRATESRTKHSSDGIRGKIAPQVPVGRRTDPVTSNVITYPMAPGLIFTQWDRTDARGTIRGYLMAASLSTPGLSLDYLGTDEVRERDEVLDMVTADAAIGGINGDFFDIADTGAPLGFGVDREQGLLHGRETGWNRAFYLNRAGTPAIGDIEMKAVIKQHPELRVGNVNSPTVAVDRVGVYTPAWGRTIGTRVTDDIKSGVREVVVKDGRVIRNRNRLSVNQKVREVVLIGRGKAAKRLGWLRVGEKVRVALKPKHRVTVAVTGNKQLLDAGIRTVVDDREMHPRTAIGIDRDTNTVLMLVIDGRQTFSRGYTMVELANLMLELGAEDALNLDGGGSSTMVGLRPDGVLGVLNSPSDGAEAGLPGLQRPVPDGLQISYLPPVARH